MVRPEPIRKRFTVPAQDESVLAWIEVQENLSFSLRALIRDYIEREGYTDPHNKPVRQLPRRGRPPVVDVEEIEEVEVEVLEEVPVSKPKNNFTAKQRFSDDSNVSESFLSNTNEKPEPVAPLLLNSVTTEAGSTDGVEGVAAFFSANRD